MARYLFILKILAVLWLISVVVVDCSEKAKRDVHRIIIKGRRPRSHSHKSKHHRHHHHGHKHPAHHHHGSYERDHSYEDDGSRYYSHENSFEDASNYKSSRENHHRNPKTSSPFPSTLNFDEPKRQSFREEWTPLLSSDNKVLRHPHESSRKRRKPFNESKRYHSPLQIDFTTNYPQKLPYPSLFETSDFPIIENSYNFNQKTIDSNQSPLIKTISLLTRPPRNQVKNVKGNKYEVNENLKDDLAVDEQINFLTVVPALRDSNAQLETAASEVKKQTVEKEEKAKVERKKPTRGSRGRRLKASTN